MKISCSQKSLFLLGLAAMTDFAFCGEAGVKSLEPIAQAMELSEQRKEVVEMHKGYTKCVNAEEITAQSGKTKGANAGSAGRVGTQKRLYAICVSTRVQSLLMFCFRVSGDI